MFRNHWRNLPRNEPELERGGEGGELGRETPRPEAEVGRICTLHILRALYSITLLCSHDTCVALELPDKSRLVLHLPKLRHDLHGVALARRFPDRQLVMRLAISQLTSLQTYPAA